MTKTQSNKRSLCIQGMIFLIVLKLLFGMIEFSIFRRRFQRLDEQTVRTIKIVYHVILLLWENCTIFFKSGKSQEISSQTFFMNPDDFIFLIVLTWILEEVTIFILPGKMSFWRFFKLVGLERVSVMFCCGKMLKHNRTVPTAI